MVPRKRILDNLKEFGSNVRSWFQGGLKKSPLFWPWFLEFQDVAVPNVVERCLVLFSFCLTNSLASCAGNAGTSFVDELWDSSCDARQVVRQFVDIKRLVIWLPLWFDVLLFQVEGHIKEVNRRKIWFFNGYFQAVPFEESIELFPDLFHSASW